MGEIPVEECKCVEFAKQKKRTLKDNILGTTKSGRAFRIGSAISLTGLGALGYNKRVAIKALTKNPKTVLKRTFTKPAGSIDSPVTTRTNAKGEVINTRTTKRRNNGLFGTKRKLKWGNIAKTGAIAGTAVVVPVGVSYVASNEEDRNKINKRLNQASKLGGKVGKTVKSTINTLHKVSR